MNDKKRRRILGISLLTLSLGLPVLLCLHLIRQEQRNQELIEAITQSDAKQVQALLAEGADANAREAPPGEKIDWHWLWDRIRHGQSRSQGQTALEVALGNELNGAHPNEQVAILQMLLEHGAYKKEGAILSDPKWKEVEKELAEAEPENAVLKTDPLLPWEMAQKEEVCRIFLSVGPSAHDFMVLANCQLQQEHYADAANAFQLAHLWAPQNDAFILARTQATKLLEVQQALSKGLPAGDTVLQVRAYPLHSGEMLWLAAIATGLKTPETLPLSGTDWVSVKKMRIALYRNSDAEWRCLAQADLHGHHDLDDKSQTTDFSELLIRTLQRPEEAEPEIVAQCICVGASWTPSHMDIFAWHNGDLKQVLDVDSSEPVWMVDPHHDGRLVVQNLYEIGTQMSHAEMPRWSDIYAWRNGRYVLANGDFPGEFTHWPKDLKGLLQRYPTDNDIWQHLGEAYTVLHQPQAAEWAYRTAQRVHPTQ